MTAINVSCANLKHVRLLSESYNIVDAVPLNVIWNFVETLADL